jgi:DNA-binding response OmpR family regulator
MRATENATVKPTVMVVEDDEDVMYLLTFMLSREGFHVISAKDGRQACTMIHEMNPPDLVLLDIMIPFVDGFQVMKQIKETPEWQDRPVVMLTSKTQERDIVRALESGAHDYVAKPFQPEELMARVRRFLKQTR